VSACLAGRGGLEPLGQQLAQLRPGDLEVRGAGQRVEEHHRGGLLEAGQMAAAVVDDGRFAEGRLRSGHHRGGDGLAPAFVGDADDGAFPHTGQGGEAAFHLAGVDVHPARHDEVGAAVGEVHVAGGVEAAEVAAAVPAVVEGGGGGGGVVPVAGQQRRRTDDELPHRRPVVGQRLSVAVDDLDHRFRHRPAGGGEHVGGGSVASDVGPGGGGDEPAGVLGHPPSLHEPVADHRGQGGEAAGFRLRGAVEDGHQGGGGRRVGGQRGGDVVEE